MGCRCARNFIAVGSGVHMFSVLLHVFGSLITVFGGSCFPGFFPLALSPAGLSILYDKYLFYPSKDLSPPRTISGVECQPLRFKLDNGNDITCRYFQRPEAKYLILVSHGNGGNMSNRGVIVEHLLKNTDCSVLLYDYEGYGQSDGEPSTKGILVDGLAVFDYAVDQLGFAPSKIILYGESLGCAVTCSVASKRTPRGIIFQSGFFSLPTAAKSLMPALKIMPGFVFPEPRLDNSKILIAEHPPLLILHGKNDKVIPFKHGSELFKRASEPKLFVPLENSGHNDIYFADVGLVDSSIAEFVRGLENMP